MDGWMDARPTRLDHAQSELFQLNVGAERRQSACRFVQKKRLMQSHTHTNCFPFTFPAVVLKSLCVALRSSRASSSSSMQKAASVTVTVAAATAAVAETPVAHTHTHTHPRWTDSAERPRKELVAVDGRSRRRRSILGCPFTTAVGATDKFFSFNSSKLQQQLLQHYRHH